MVWCVQARVVAHPHLVDPRLHALAHSLVSLVLVALEAMPAVGRDLDSEVAAWLVADRLARLVDGDDAHAVQAAALGRSRWTRRRCS